MDSERPQLSITLPRNFYFHYRDGMPPQTPEPEPQVEHLQPPPPPRQTLKVRRRRHTAVAIDDDAARIDELMDDGLVAQSQPIPTIEAPEIHSDETIALPEFPLVPDSAYLSPAVTFSRMVSPPKTPELQMRRLGGFDIPQPWDNDSANMSECSSRPTSSSGFSDSSVSSRGSFESFPSFGGSCTSPDEDMTDPFSFCTSDMKYDPTSPSLASRPGIPPKMKLRATFTEEMDAHLWMTYMKYLQDPTVTPFKALPSTVPPNGVCHRVARMARKTWKGGRVPTCLSISRAATEFASRSGTPDTIKPTKSGSSTPIARSKKPYLRYPSEKQARKRLRELAKQKPHLSAHYQRLLHRSPSPFQSSPQEEQSTSQPAGLSSPFSAGVSTFSTRDMNVSLATSTAASMQFGNPLAQLATDVTPRAPGNEWSKARSSAHQKSQSLHIGLGLGGMIGSSFAAMSQMTVNSLNQPTSQTWHAQPAHPPRLGSPLQLHAPRPISRPFRRRALHNFEEQLARNRTDSFVNHVFGAPAESSHRRVRSRGFSLGDMAEGARRLPGPSVRPAEAHPFSANLTAMMPDHNPSSAPFVVQDQATIRLGSPFVGRPSNTFPRTNASFGFEAPASFEQRFAGLPSDPDLLNRS
ncbi:hypothetical protein BCR34DRAFT_144538 [Clohesyomyces aquaticus]|uniref:Uncharacterized protein n=1 Tax=Clohesyomyces aquaticus TaxID=1231657 RepID=A0A1Y2A0E2_9PLEO|nr:hypothetical protein BCR34DRAFT_144538 [Clohesyomyces aquaticus]